METNESWTTVKTHKIWINGKLCGCAEGEIAREEIGSDWSDEVVKLKTRHKAEFSMKLEDEQLDHIQLIYQIDPESMRNRSTRGMLRRGYVVFFPFDKDIVDGIPFVPRWSK